MWTVRPSARHTSARHTGRHSPASQEEDAAGRAHVFVHVTRTRAREMVQET